MQSSRGPPPPHGATPSPPTDSSHSTHSSIPNKRLTESMMPYYPVDHHNVLPSTSAYQDAVPWQYAASWDAPMLDAGASSEHPSSTSLNSLGMVTPSNEGTVSRAHATPRSVKDTYSFCGHAGVLDDMFPSDPSTNPAGYRQVDVNMRSSESFTAQDQSQDMQHHDHIVPDVPDNSGVAQNIPIQGHFAPPAPVVVAFNDNVQQDAQSALAGDAPPFLEEDPHQGPVPNGRASELLRQLALLYLNDPNSQLITIRMGPGHDSEVTVDITLKLTNL